MLHKTQPFGDLKIIALKFNFNHHILKLKKNGTEFGKLSYGRNALTFLNNSSNMISNPTGAVVIREPIKAHQVKYWTTTCICTGKPCLITGDSYM